jgi:hypothetical protein
MSDTTAPLCAGNVATLHGQRAMGAEKRCSNDDFVLSYRVRERICNGMRKPKVTYTLSDDTVAMVNSYDPRRFRSRSEAVEYYIWAGIVADKQMNAYEQAAYQQHVYEIASCIAADTFGYQPSIPMPIDHEVSP